MHIRAKVLPSSTVSWQVTGTKSGSCQGHVRVTSGSVPNSSYSTLCPLFIFRGKTGSLTAATHLTEPVN